MRQLAIALVIPAWNEEASLGSVLSEVPPESVGRVFVVSGNSTDHTAQIAAAHGALALGQDRPGYGAACAAGVRAAAAWGAAVVVFLDGDYSDPPSALPEVLRPILAGQADLVLGNRVMPRGSQALPLHARLGNQLVLQLLSRLLGRRLRDLPSFKAIRLSGLQRLEMSEQTYGWTVEMLVKALRADLRIAEVAVEYRPRLGGASKVSGTWRGTLGAGWKLCSCAVRYARWTPALPSPRSVGALP
jgi:glycosyltransferase involved in cell wall biosynthesis